jgi:hypothetical protein
MIGAVAAGSKKRAAGGVTLDDIYARHTWAVRWDGAHGVNAGAETVSTRSGTSFDNGVHVVRMEYNATHASHVMRVDGVAYTTAASTADITLNADLSGVYFGDYYGGLLDVAAVFWCPYASINDTQAAQVETDLLTIMGL